MKRFISDIKLTKFPTSLSRRSFKSSSTPVLYQGFFVHSTSYLESLHTSPSGGFGGGPFPLWWAHGNPSVKGKIGPWCKVLFWSSPFLIEALIDLYLVPWNEIINIVIVVTSKLFYMLEIFLQINLNLVLNRWSITFKEPNIFYFYRFLIF